MTTLLVCGGRHYGDSDTLFVVLDRIRHEADVTLVVHGGATGADARWQKCGLAVAASQRLLSQ